MDMISTIYLEFLKLYNNDKKIVTLATIEK